MSLSPELEAKILQNPEYFNDIEFFFSNERNALAYDERPADIETFITSPKYLNLGSVIRPAVLWDLKDLFSDKKSFAFCSYEEAAFNEAIGSGKSFKTSIIVSYVLHHLLCLKNPQEYFGLDKSSLIAVMNMSVNATQARKVVFGEIQHRIKSSPWFEAHHIDPTIRSELRFEKNITVIPGHSGVNYPLGYNLVVAVMDEAAFYNVTKESDDAQEMFYALKRRIQSRFGKNGLLVMISSPRYTDDFIERKMAEAEHEPHRIFARRRAIWEALPEDIEDIASGDTFELNGMQIPNKYKDDFAKNPEKAWRDLGAKPSLVLEPYIKQFDFVEQCIDGKLMVPFANSEDEQHGILRTDFINTYKAYYYIHIDLSLTGDATGLAMAHKHTNGMIVVDLIRRIEGSKEKEIDIGEIRNFVLALQARGYKIGKVTYDQFQSASSIQEFKKKGIESERLSVDSTLAPYETLKELCYNGTVQFYRHEHFLREMKRLELVQGKKVDHPVRGSKDVSDAVAGAVFNAVNGEPYRTITMSIV